MYYTYLYLYRSKGVNVDLVVLCRGLLHPSRFNQIMRKAHEQAKEKAAGHKRH